MLISFYELQILLVHFQILIYSFDLLIVFKSASRVGAKAWPWQSFQYYGHHGHLLILINLLTPEPGVGRRMDTNKARWRQGNHCPGYGGLTAGPGCVADGSLWVLLGPFASCYGAEPRARGTIRIMSPTSRSTQIKCWGRVFMSRVSSIKLYWDQGRFKINWRSHFWDLWKVWTIYFVLKFIKIVNRSGYWMLHQIIPLMWNAPPTYPRQYIVHMMFQMADDGHYWILGWNCWFPPPSNYRHYLRVQVGAHQLLHSGETTTTTTAHFYNINPLSFRKETFPEPSHLPSATQSSSWWPPARLSCTSPRPPAAGSQKS